MELAEAQVIKQGNNLHVQHGTDSGLYVEFFIEAVQDEEKSKEAGRPIYKDVEMISIRILGDKNTHMVRPIDYKGSHTTPPDNVRFAAAYAQFKNKNLQVSEGTPITEWGILTKSQAMMFKALNIHTVEALASVSDANLSNLGMGARDYREKAIAFINQAKDGSGLVKLQEENKDLRVQLEALKNQMKAFSENIPKNKGGRPPKKKEEVDGQNAFRIGASRLFRNGHTSTPISFRVHK